MRFPKLSRSSEQNATYVRWAQKGTLAIADQGVFSGSNFIISVLLARWMSESDYGAYSITFSIFLLISGFYNVLLMEPMSIFGPVRHSDHFPTYLKRMTWLHAAGAIVSTAGLALAAGIAYLYDSESHLAGALLGLGLGHGLTLLFWLTRRACYVKHQIGKALSGTVVYSVAIIAGFAYLHVVDLLTPLSAFVFIGLAGVIAGIFQFAVLLKEDTSNTALSDVPMRALAYENWTYGRWMIVASTASWLSTWAYFVLAGGMLSLEEVAGLKAMQNLVMPITQVFTAFMMLFAPWASQRFAQQGFKALKEAMQIYSLSMSAMWLAYFFVVLLFQNELLKVLYGDSFSQYQWLLPLYLFQPLIIAAAGSWIYGLRIVDKTRNVMILNIIGGITTLTVGVALITFWGLQGAVIGIMLSSFISVPVLLVMWQNLGRQLAQLQTNPKGS